MIALDIDKSIVEVCRDRCEILGLDNIEYFSCGLLEYASIKNKDDSIDAIIFYATLEHMSLIDQREENIKKRRTDNYFRYSKLFIFS